MHIIVDLFDLVGITILLVLLGITCIFLVVVWLIQEIAELCSKRNDKFWNGKDKDNDRDKEQRSI